MIRNRDPFASIKELSGVGFKLAKRIVEDLGDGDPFAALGTIEVNPYSLIDVDGFAFKKADKIALTDFTLSMDDPRRHMAGNRYVLEQKGVLPEREFFSERVKIGLNNPDFKEYGVETEEGRVWLPEELAAEIGLEGWMRKLPSLAEALPNLTEVQFSICERLRLDDVQRGAVQSALHTRVLCLTGGAGCGKCLAAGTPILMYDGSIKPVEEIKVGDLLMGPNSTPRRVLSLARGREMMYRITPTKGDAYTVNESHILSLRMNDRGMGYQKGEIVNIGVLDYLQASTRFKKQAKGWRTGVDFPAQEVPLDPYILGIWLGDGTSDQPHVTTMDSEVQDALREYAGQNGLIMRHVAESGMANTWGLTTGPAFEGCQREGRNPLITALKGLGVWKNKHVPQVYLGNTAEVRAQLLPGLLDSDGSYHQGCFDFLSKHRQISEAVAFLARSLGMAAYVKECQRGYKTARKEFVGTYWRVGISGHTDCLPLRVSHKKAAPRQQVKNVLNVGITVEAVGEDDYYGFTIDGDHLFMLGDFTVTHNTHVVAALAQCLLADRRSVRGMAFAGKAADRMREAFDQYGVMAEASTIHKALGFQKRGFTVDVLPEDLIVIDEASMLPNWLLWAVIMRMKPGATLILVGDPNQLPPIGYGTPFTDLIKHGCPRAHLSRNYRQADQQGILHMAEGILERRRPAPADCVEMHLGVDPAALEELFDGLVQQHGGQDFEAWQIITYTNEIAERYNLRAQNIINPDGTPLFEYPLWKLGTGERNRPLHHAEIRTGDKVIVVKNSTLLSIFNGQTGRVVGLVSKAKQVNRKGLDGRWEEAVGEIMPHLRVEITGRAVDIPEDEVEKYLQLGYIITVHKAQGSDWDRVIVMQPGKVRDDTAKRFFYTACSRAKNHLCIVSGLRVVAWWTNAAADAPDEPSSLLVRLSRPAPCVWCGHEGCGVCDPEIAAAAEAKWGPDPLVEQDDPFLADGPVYWAEYEAYVPVGMQHLADEIGVQEPLLISEWEDLKAHRIQEIKDAFQRLEVA